MRLVIVLVLAVSGSAHSLHIDEAKFSEAVRSNPRFLQDLLERLLDQIRELMKNGSDTIPVLDPFVIESIHVDEGLIGIPGAFMKLNNLTVSNLSTFKIDTLQIDIQGILIQRYTITFDGYIPEINIDTSNYDFFLGIFGGEIYGTGDMKLKIKEPRVKGVIEAALTTNNGIFLTMNECNIEFSLGAFEPEITGFWNSETSSAFVSAFLRNLIPELLEFFENDINNIISEGVFTVGNEILSNFDLIDLIRP